MMTDIMRTLRHELGHAVCGVQFGAVAKITDEGPTMRCDLDWGDKSPTEFEVLTTWAAGWMAEAECMSSEDRIVRAAMPVDLRLKAEAYARERVIPILDRITPEAFRGMLKELTENGEISVLAEP